MVVGRGGGEGEMAMEMVFGCSIESTEPTVRYSENTSYTPYTYRASECICYGTPVDYVIAHQPCQYRHFPTHMFTPYPPSSSLRSTSIRSRSSACCLSMVSRSRMRRLRASSCSYWLSRCCCAALSLLPDGEGCCRGGSTDGGGDSSGDETDCCRPAPSSLAADGCCSYLNQGISMEEMRLAGPRARSSNPGVVVLVEVLSAPPAGGCDVGAVVVVSVAVDCVSAAAMVEFRV